MKDAARLMVLAKKVKSVDLDNVRELSYLLYSIANDKHWADTALLFNELGTSWPDIELLSGKAEIIATARTGPDELPLDYSSGDNTENDDDGDD